MERRKPIGDSGSAGGAGSWAGLGKAPGKSAARWRNEQMDMQRTARETLKAFLSRLV